MFISFTTLWGNTLYSSLNPKQHFAGEIVESSLFSFVAQCPADRLYEPPLFGSFVRTPLPPLCFETPSPKGEVDPFTEAVTKFPYNWEEGTTYAVVCMASTRSLDPSRRPSAYGLNEAQLRAEQPQIFDLLQTEFTALSVGYVHQGRLRYTLPTRPPRIHAFVGECSAPEIHALTQTPEYLRLLLQVRGEVSADELVVATLRQVCEVQTNPYEYLVKAGRYLAHLLREEPERLTAILKQLEPSG